MPTATEQEIEAYDKLILDAQAIADDPLADPETVEQALQTVAVAEQRRRDAIDRESGTIPDPRDATKTIETQPILQPRERRFRNGGKSTVVNEHGYGEPDIANPDPLTTPADTVLTPDEIAQIDEQQQQAAENIGLTLPASASVTLTVATKDDYEAVVKMGNDLGLDALEVGQLWSRLQMQGFGADGYTQLGMYALKIAVECQYMRKVIAKWSTDLMMTQNHITRLHAPPVVEKEKSSKSRRGR